MTYQGTGYPGWNAYPCDRGIPGNVGGRGYHHFQAGVNGIVCCIYCGKRGPQEPIEVTYDNQS